MMAGPDTCIEKRRTCLLLALRPAALFSTPYARWDTRLFGEDAREMTLIGEPALQRNVRDCQRTRQKRFGSLDAVPHQTTMGRHAGRSAECRGEVSPR